jgi:glycosyltransferase involved in cell wall biosynthesis
MNKKYVINGKFMADRMQGIVRYGREILNSLDAVLDNNSLKIILAVPSNAVDIPKYKHIDVIRLGKRKGIAWEQLDLGRYIRKNQDYMLVNFCNVTPFLVRPGITVVHDIMYKTFPENCNSIRNKISRIWHCIQYKYIFNHEKIILTVSNFSKYEIEKNYPKAKGKIHVIPNGWQHVMKYGENPDWNKKYSFLHSRKFYFSLATLAANKNVNWTIQVARHNPNEEFAIGGKIYEFNFEKIPDNVHLLGFVSDADACSLIKNCKAFLYPSVYEGFGIPPLEALALGAEVLSSDATSLPEVLGTSAHYFDPYNYEVDLNDLLREPVDQSALNNYSWDKSAELLKLILEKNE